MQPSDCFVRRVVVAPTVLAKRVGAETVLLNQADERYYGLDEVATIMWEALLEAPTVGQACERLLAEYEVDPERLRSDVAQFVEQLLEHGLVQLVD